MTPKENHEFTAWRIDQAVTTLQRLLAAQEAECLNETEKQRVDSAVGSLKGVTVSLRTRGKAL